MSTAVASMVTPPASHEFKILNSTRNLQIHWTSRFTKIYTAAHKIYTSCGPLIHDVMKCFNFCAYNSVDHQKLPIMLAPCSMISATYIARLCSKLYMPAYIIGSSLLCIERYY